MLEIKNISAEDILDVANEILNGEKIIGTHINFSDPSVGRIAGLAGFDYISNTVCRLLGIN